MVVESVVHSVVALVPSHNEEVGLPEAIRALQSQTVALERIIVVSDHSTDRTPEIAVRWGGQVELFETVNNTHRKAGALNQALATLLPQLSDLDWVLVMDADSRVTSGFVARAMALVESDPRIGAVGGIFLADGVRTLLERLQANEYFRYAREIARNRAQARVLTGTATFARVGTLKAIARARVEGRLPGEGVYHQDALCEDFELTLAMKSLGYACVSPKECVVRTEVLPTLGELWRQRVRWQRGALQCLRAYGLSRVTLPYLLKQAETSLGIVCAALMVAITGWSLWTGVIEIRWFWCALGAVFLAERVVSVWRAGRVGRALAISILPELLYDYLICAVFVYVWAQVALGREGTWGRTTIDTRR